jgi:hypothetical protein
MRGKGKKGGKGKGKGNGKQKGGRRNRRWGSTFVMHFVARYMLEEDMFSQHPVILFGYVKFY